MCILPIVALLAASQSVAFRYHSPTAKAVAFAADLNLWNPAPMKRAGADWLATFRLPDDARLEYKFVVDGNWILDPNDPKHNSNGMGGENSVYEGSSYRPAPYPDGRPKDPMTRTEMTVAGRKVVVFAPRDAHGLPILAYADGDTYEGIGHIANVYQNLVEAGKLRPAVLVLVPPRDRMSEYGAEWHAYGALLLSQVLPAVRVATGASGRPEDVFLGGSSMGGVIALRLAEEFPHLVQGGVQSQSGAFQFAPLNIRYDSLVAPSALQRLSPGLRLWLDWGTFEGSLSRSNDEAAQNLRKLGIPFGSKTSDEGHNWTAWRNRMAPGLEYILGPRRAT